MNPFDPRTVALAKHAQHVVLIHFPIAAFMIAVGFDYSASWTRNQTLAAAAYFNLLIAAASTIPVLVTGVIAWQWVLEGQALKGILLMHVVLGAASSAIITFAWWIHWHERRGRVRPLPAYRLPVEAIGVILIALTGHLGGFLSGVNGPS